MKAIEALIGRRSIRKYTEEKIQKEKITTLLKAAMNAPSGAPTSTLAKDRLFSVTIYPSAKADTPT